MKQHFRLFYVALFFLITVISVYGGGPLTFKEYRSMTQQERQKVAADAPAELKKKLNNWDEILSMGGQWWKWWQARALVDKKDFDGLLTLFTTQEGLWGYYKIHTLDANKKSGMTPNAQNSAEQALQANFDAKRKECLIDHYWYLVKLAPTAEAVALNEEAMSIAAKWNERCPMDGIHTISIEELKSLDAEVKVVRDKMRKLPQWTPEQIMDAISTLPDEEPQRSSI